MKPKTIFNILKQTFREWTDDKAFRLAAALSYYTIFSLPGILIIIIWLAGYFFGEEAIQGQVQAQVGDLIGSDSAGTVEQMIKSARNLGDKWWAVVIGIGALLFGATGAFYQMQEALNTIWDVRIKKDVGIMGMVRARLTSFSIVIFIGFLLLVSLLVSAGISAFGNLLNEYLGDYFKTLIWIIELIVSLGVFTVLFAMIFKVLPDVEIQWSDVWRGAFFTAVLFVLGKFLISLYIGQSDPGSSFGAAGSLVLILLWVNYSCLILFFGAEFTQVYVRRQGRIIRPSKHAEKIRIEVASVEKG